MVVGILLVLEGILHGCNPYRHLVELLDDLLQFCGKGLCLAEVRLIVVRPHLAKDLCKLVGKGNGGRSQVLIVYTCNTCKGLIHRILILWHW